MIVQLQEGLKLWRASVGVERWMLARELSRLISELSHGSPPYSKQTWEEIHQARDELREGAWEPRQI